MPICTRNASMPMKCMDQMPMPPSASPDASTLMRLGGRPRPTMPADAVRATKAPTADRMKDSATKVGSKAVGSKVGVKRSLHASCIKNVT
jgi:hypothetical protein